LATALTGLILGGAALIALWSGGGTAADGDDRALTLEDVPVIQKPRIMPGGRTWARDDVEVIGVSAAGRHRAYLVRAFAPPDAHVVNDELGGVPVTVCYCDRTECVQVFTHPDKLGPLDVAYGGYLGKYDLGSMLLRVGPWHYRLDTRQPLEEDAPAFPYVPAGLERMTWKRWREAHPDTDFYAGAPRAGEVAGLAGQQDWPVIQNPHALSAAVARLRDDAPVIGVSAGGRHRAYLVRAFAALERHVVNDQLGGVPVTVSFCSISDCAQAFTGPRGRGPLDVAVGGFVGEYDWGGMLLRVGPWHYQQDTGQPVEKDAPPLPYSPAGFERTIWKQWRDAHPDTDVYVGEPPQAPSGTQDAPEPEA
jgi:hypothetical protein